MLLGATIWISFSGLLVTVSSHTLNVTSTTTSVSSTSQVHHSGKGASSSPSPSSASSLSASSSSSSQSLSFSAPPSAFPTGIKNPKRGLSYASGGNFDDILNANQTKSSISWIYDWSDLPAGFLAQSGLNYIPMQWGSGNIDKLANTISTQGADIVLGFNEPDFADEANIPAKEAAGLWMQFIEPLKQKDVKLGGPAVTAAPSGKPWLSEFLAECNNCTIDFLPLHWYGSGTEGFFNYIWDMHSTFPQFPIWITEFAEISDNATVVLDFMNQTINYLDSLDWVERYAWFGFFRPEKDLHSNMLREDGGLNDLGKLYIGAQTVHTSNRTDEVGPSYATVSPSDHPGQPLVTSWPGSNTASPVASLAVLQGSILVGSLLFGVLLAAA
ncbi:hypothetical protein AGABI2DRAFT_189310 [Agaricus bisporus var. bisporus H97]|uniref:hypothetical protein n=1 Tax=Agaricus bisporus var. bisporus (strain H97 / ATCC MYA-4626 / FGSC 10389) TaxID=936046 RepID=UPI00029F5C0F|nr:hypothetical protein AGABI2DRAFT_189310 [Agaricus bisporus var. bisporus H97]EKV51001.1 hypothetical protein AGABI2DRAFT_189310 [Agaricus bisporus var. bisporus H97]